MLVVMPVVTLLVTGILRTAQMASAGRLTVRAIATMIVLLWASAAMAAVVTPALLAAFAEAAELKGHVGDQCVQHLAALPNSVTVAVRFLFAAAVVAAAAVEWRRRRGPGVRLSRPDAGNII